MPIIYKYRFQNWSVWIIQVQDTRSLGQTCHIGQFEKVAIELPRSAVWTTLFFVDSNCRPWQFHGHVLKLPTLAVSWPVFSPLGLLVLKLPTLAVSWPLFSHLPYPWRDWCSQTADLGSFMAGFQHCDLKLPTLAVSWPVFSTPVALALKLPTLAVLWPFSSNCRPWQFHGHFSAISDEDLKNAFEQD